MNEKCILIPTYNRSREIAYYLENRLVQMVAAGYDVVIYDSSTDDQTKDIVEKYIAVYGDSVQYYYYYQDPQGDMYGARKVKIALLECALRYKYVWLCGDTVLLNVGLCDERLRALYRENYDVIHVYKNNLGLDDAIDIKWEDFFKNFYWSMTHWCSFVLSAKLIIEMDSIMEFYLNSDCVNIIIHSIYTKLVDNKWRIAYVNCDCIEVSPYRSVSVSQKNKDLLRGWAQATCVGIDNLPDVYNQYKSEAKLITNKNVNLFTRKGACDLRADGNLSLKGLIKYGKYVSQMAGDEYIWNILWSILPRGLAKKRSYIYNARELTEKIGNNHSKVIVYGLGEHGKFVIRRFQYAFDDSMVLAIVDKSHTGESFDNISVIPKEKIIEYDYEYVLVAIIDKNVFKEVKKDLVRHGVNSSKIKHI